MLLVMLEALSKCGGFHLLYLDLLIHESHQQHAAAHGLWQGVGVRDLQSNSFVHYNPPGHLNDKDTFLTIPRFTLFWRQTSVALEAEHLSRLRMNEAF